MVVLKTLMAQGVQEGALRPIDPGEAAVALMGIVHFRVGAATHGGPPLGPDTATPLLDIFLRGVLK